MIRTLDRKLLRDLAQMKGQVVSIAFVIASGVALLVMSLSAVEAVREEGGDVVALLAIFSYGLPAARDAVEKDGVPMRVLTTFECLVDVAGRTGRISADGIASLRTWHADPIGWSDARKSEA